MPIYFGDVAPHCPISKDQPVGMPTRPLLIRTSIPRAFDLASALAAVNILRSIVIQLSMTRTVNNVYTKPPPAPRKPPEDKVIDKTRPAGRWVEQKSKRVKKKYKYYGTDDGRESKEIWAITERIERMVWYDKAWKTYLVFSYGDKGEGTPV